MRYSYQPGDLVNFTGNIQYKNGIPVCLGICLALYKNPIIVGGGWVALVLWIQPTQYACRTWDARDLMRYMAL